MSFAPAANVPNLDPPCDAPSCILNHLIGFYMGPKLEILCKQHAKEYWHAERLRIYKEKGWDITPAASKPASGNPLFAQKRLSGVHVVYPGLAHLKKGVPSIWTPTKCYPYPNHRRKLGLNGSYPVAQCQVVSWGKHQDPSLNIPQPTAPQTPQEEPTHAS